MVGLAAALTAAIAATTWPDAVRMLAVPSPPFTVAVVAPVPAPTLPSANGPVTAARAAA